MTNLNSILNSRDITLLTKVHIVKAMVFPESCTNVSWTIKQAECRRTDASQLWCWRRLFRVPWTVKRSSKSILKEINPEYSLEGLMIKLYSNTLVTWFEERTHRKDPDAGKNWRQEKGVTEDEIVGYHHQLSEHELEQTPGDDEVWCAAVHGVTTSWTRLSNWTTTMPSYLSVR